MRSTTSGPNGWQWTARLFVTCWFVYGLHFATNMARENYLALAIGDHGSFRLDEYAHLHDDIIETPEYGWHIASNPGASMLAAVPYSFARPIIDSIVGNVRRSRENEGLTEPPAYAAPKAVDRDFYAKAWRRGDDVKFGLSSLVMQVGCMSVLSASAVVAMFALFLQLTRSRSTAMWMSLLYAFGTPVFFRTGFLNHNMILGHVAFAGFIAMWNPWHSLGGVRARRFALGGLAGGTCLLLDYSGVVALLGLLTYGVILVRPTSSARERMKYIGAYALGALGPVALLWWYQWQSFGHPFFPPQHWMRSVDLVTEGYQGFSLPQPALAVSLALDWRYGLFASCPLFLLALAAPFSLERRRQQHHTTQGAPGAFQLPKIEFWTCVGLVAAFGLFFSGVHYTRWQFNTGVRYLAPTFPFLFMLAAGVLLRLPRWIGYLVSVLAIGQAWSMAMYRDVSGGKVELNDPDVGLGVLDPILHALSDGPALPALTTLSRMDGYGRLTASPLSPTLVLVLAAAILCLVWWPLARRSRTTQHRGEG